MSRVHLDQRLPREAFGPRELARAGDLWRLLQDAAVRGSSALGWPPERYVAEGCAFVVRRMVVVHDRPTRFGDTLSTETWVSSMRRDTFTTREIRVTGPSGSVVRTTQSWVHVSAPSLRPGRANASLLEALAVVEGDPSVTLEALPEAGGAPSSLSFRCWHTWMDPLAHANHPAYIDWIDEALALRVAEAGGDPHTVQPVADDLTFRSGVVAPEEVTVTAQRIGHADGVDAVAVRILGGDGRVCADGEVRRRGLGDALS